MARNVFCWLGVFGLALIGMSCGVDQKEYDRVLRENTELKQRVGALSKELDDLKHGAEKLHAKMKIAFENEDIASCKAIYADMSERHPESALFDEVEKIYLAAVDMAAKKEEERLIEAEKARAEQQKKEEQQQAERLKRDEEQRIKAEKARAERLRSLEKLKKTVDDVSGMTWYKQAYFVHYTNRNLVSIYIGQKRRSVWLRLRMSYEGEDWIFFEEAYLSYDGNTREISFDRYDDKKTDSDTRTWEWIDVLVSEDLAAYLARFAHSENAKVRFKGKYTRTRTLSRQERQGILDVLIGYSVLKEELE